MSPDKRLLYACLAVAAATALGLVGWALWMLRELVHEAFGL